MPRSSRHKSHKQSKHSSKDYSDSDEDAVRVKDRSSRDDVSIRAHRDSASGEKRKISSEVPEGKGTKDLSGVGNGEIMEEYASSKRRKERTDADVGGDRWSGGGDDRGNGDRNVEKENHKGDSMKVGTKLKDKGENLKIDLKIRSKRRESGPDERKEDSLTEQVESKSRGESKRRSERDSSSRKELKDKDRWSEKEKNGAQEKKNSDAGVKFVDKSDGNKETQIGDIGEERQGKRTRENTDQTLRDELRSHELEKEAEKKARRKREGSSERGKHYEDSKEGDERQLSSRVDRAKDLKYKDDKHKDGSYEDKYQEDSHKDERRRDDKYQEDSHKDERRRDDKEESHKDERRRDDKEDSHKDERRRDDKHREEADRDYKSSDDKYRDGEKNTRRRGDRHREDSDRDGRRRDEKHREDGERDSRRKDDKYREGIERDGRRDDKYHEDGDRDRRRKDARHYEDGDRDYRRGDERYRDSGERDDRRRDSSYKDDGNRDYRHKEEKYREDIEKDIRHKDSKQGDGHEKEKRIRDPKYRDEWMSRDRSGKSDSKHAKDDDYADHHTRKSSAYDDSPVHDDRTARYRRNNEKEDYGDNKSRGTKDQRFDAEKMSSGGARIDLTTDRGRSGSSKAADIELTSSHSRRWSSPTSSAHVPKDNYRALKQDESKYGDGNYEEKDQHAGSLGGSEKTSYQQLEKLNKKDDGYLGEISAERRLKSDIGRSPSHPGDKSPSTSIGKRQFNRVDARRGTDFEESTQRSGGSREWKEYSGKEGRGSREVGMDVIPGEEPLQADVDTVSVSSPFMRNNHFSSNSKSLAPPPLFRGGVGGSSSLLGLAEDDARGKSNIRYRRTGDPNMGRIQGNAWGGVPGWPSPVANGFLPFPPHVTFPSVMQPFTAPPMYGVRRSMEFDHPAPYHMPDSDRFPGPVRPMGWGHQIDNSGHPLHSWDARNAVFGDDSHVYGRSDWDHSGNVPGGQIGDTSTDLWAGQNRTGSMEISYLEKENDATRSGETLGKKSSQLVPSELNRGELGEALELDKLTKSSAKDLVEAPLISTDDAKSSKNDDVRLFHVYLSKLDISADLTEPELLNECSGLIDMNTGSSSDKDDYNILYIEDEVTKMSSHSLLSHKLFASTDDSIFLKSMSLYKRQKEKFLAEVGGNLKLSSDFVESCNQDDQDIAGDKTEVVCPEDNMPEQYENALQVADTAETMEEAISPKDDDDMELKVGFDVGQQGHPVETPQSAVGAEEPDASSAFEEKYMLVETPPTAVGAEEPVAPSTFGVKDVLMESADACNNEEVKLLDSKCVPMVNSDVSAEAIMSESVMSGFVNSSRIHHSPESTH